ncbi:AAA family ATPase [Lewinella sp. JB7]|uniref:AAA family ATPase n=1 Tax=Lewinella sp. JB7 TaxID=2962887 RepID=UPI0020C9F232|nr:ATP-binding protein [Lewinella sp. JB7]MCP9237945.1 ATP-binding protein [Lewinella sp. JB7]
MRLKFEGSYKSITSFEWDNVPKLTVITGKNGTGKTQLLELIASHFYKYSHVRNTLTGTLSIENVDYKAKDVLVLQGNWGLGSSTKVSSTKVGEHRRSTYLGYTKTVRGQRLNDNSREQLYEVLDEVFGKERSAISEDEFLENFPPIVDFQPHKLVEELAAQFCDYRIQELEYLAEHGNLNKFVELHGPKPWKELNSLLAKINFSYKFVSPAENSLRYSYSLSLRDNDSGNIIELNDLSSGEKIIMSLLLYILISKVYNRTPKLILLDEPDAHLHPSLTREFVSGVNDILVGEFGCQVIMTTHSPSTVSLVPIETLFEMSRSAPKIRKLNYHSDAVNLLTSGFLSVSKGTTYVLVEDNEDVDFYSEILEMLANIDLLPDSADIAFISASKGKGMGGGGKTVVLTWVEKLTEAGLANVFAGLVDRDYNASSTPNVVNTSRHSLENYLLDPIVIFATLLQDDRRTFERFGFAVGKEHELKFADEDVLQAIASNITDPLNLKVKQEHPKSSDRQTTIEYHNGLKINVPIWILKERGKSLMQLFRKTYGPRINHRDLMLSYRRVHLHPVDLIENLKELI